MATKYLLPCTQCDQNVAVTIGQAGDTVHCECGAALNVPPMREIRQLEAQKQSTPEVSASNWSPKQGALLLGLVVALAGAGAGIYQWSQMPTKPQSDPEANLRSELQRIDAMTASQAWVFWHYDIIEFELSPLQSTQEYYYEAQASIIRPRMIFFFVVAALGVVLAISSFFWPAPQ